MGAFRQTAALLFVAMLALASIERAEAAVLLPEMEALLEGATRPEAVSKGSASQSADRLSEPDETDEPLPAGLRIPPQGPATSTTSSSTVTGTATGGAALAGWTITLVGGSLSDTLEREPRCGRVQLDRTGIFRPPRRAV